MEWAETMKALGVVVDGLIAAAVVEAEAVLQQHAMMNCGSIRSCDSVVAAY